MDIDERNTLVERGILIRDTSIHAMIQQVIDISLYTAKPDRRRYRRHASSRMSALLHTTLPLSTYTRTHNNGY